MKKALKILGITVIVLYFISNILPNVVGVPLAAFQSYQAWKDNGKSSFEIQSESSSNNQFPKSIGIINDFSQILTASQRNELSQILYDYDIQTTRQIVIVTVDSISPYNDIHRYAKDLANNWGVGTAKDNNGLTIVICNPIRQIAIATGTGTELILTDELCKTIIDSTIVPEFKSENYYNGIKMGVTKLIEKWN